MIAENVLRRFTIFDATDVLCGHYQLELMLHGNHMDGIDRKAGFPVPVLFSRV